MWWSSHIDKSKTFKEVRSDDIQLSVVRKSDPVSLAIIEKINNIHYFSLFRFNYDEENFTKVWERSIETSEEITLIGSEDKALYFAKGDFYFKIDQNELVQVSEMDDLLNFTGPDGKKIDISSAINEYDQFSFNRNNFKSFSLTDLDLDSEVDIIAVDTSGNIHAFDQNLVSKSGFPKEASAINNVLISDISGDSHPELIYEQEDRSLIIADSKGRTISISSLPLSSYLKSVGLFNDRKAIIFSCVAVLCSVLFCN